MVTTKLDEFKYIDFLANITNTSVHMCASFMNIERLVDYRDEATDFLLRVAEKRYGPHAQS